MESYERDDLCDFHLEIHSLETFIAFVAVLRNETLDSAKILEMTAHLRASNRDLAAAERQAKADIPS